jgi:alcohol dehydrogenase class IV
VIHRVRLSGYGVWYNDRRDSTHLCPWWRAAMWGAVIVAGAAVAFAGVLAVAHALDHCAGRL